MASVYGRYGEAARHSGVRSQVNSPGGWVRVQDHRSGKRSRVDGRADVGDWASRAAGSHADDLGQDADCRVPRCPGPDGESGGTSESGDELFAEAASAQSRVAELLHAPGAAGLPLTSRDGIRGFSDHWREAGGGL